MQLPRSTYYYRSTAAETGLSDARLVDLIGDIQDALPGYGYRRVPRELHAPGHIVNHSRFRGSLQFFRHRQLNIDTPIRSVIGKRPANPP